MAELNQDLTASQLELEGLELRGEHGGRLNMTEAPTRPTLPPHTHEHPRDKFQSVHQIVVANLLVAKKGLLPQLEAKHLVAYQIQVAGSVPDLRAERLLLDGANFKMQTDLPQAIAVGPACQDAGVGPTTASVLTVTVWPEMDLKH